MKIPAIRLNPGRIVLSVVTGLIGSLGYFEYEFPGVGLVWPFLLAIQSSGRLRDAFLSGWTSGTSFFGASLYWLWNNPYPQGAIPGWAILSIYSGIYIGLWSWLAAFFWREISNPNAVRRGSRYLLTFASWPGWGMRLAWALFAAGAWVCLEWLRSVMITGFPWNLLGISQAPMPVFSQLARWGGVPLVSMTVCFMSLIFGLSLLQIVRQPGSPVVGLREASPAMVIVMLLLSLIPLKPQPGSGEAAKKLNIAAIQPGFSQSDIWNADKDHRTKMWDHLLGLTRSALESTNSVELVMWPEGASPVIGQKELEVVSNLAAEFATPFAICLETADFDPENPGKMIYFNSAMFIDGRGRWHGEDGETYALYHKQHLVPFGEFIPMVSIFPFLKKLIPIGGFERGAEPGLFHWKEKDIHLAFCICFEDTMAPLIRKSTTAQTQIILNMTNDAWFGRGAAQVLHARHALFRSIELGIPMVRATNNGLTCWTDPGGKLQGVHFPDDHDRPIHDAGIKFLEIPVRNGSITPYRQYGYRLQTGVLVLTVGLMATGLLKGRSVRQGI